MFRGHIHSDVEIFSYFLEFSLSDNLSREDKAVSTISFFSEMFLNIILMRAKNKKGSRFLIGGNLVRSQSFREHMFTFFNTTPEKVRDEAAATCFR